MSVNGTLALREKKQKTKKNIHRQNQIKPYKWTIDTIYNLN